MLRMTQRITITGIVILVKNKETCYIWLYDKCILSGTQWKELLLLFKQKIFFAWWALLILLFTYTNTIYMSSISTFLLVLDSAIFSTKVHLYNWLKTDKIILIHSKSDWQPNYFTLGTFFSSVKRMISKRNIDDPIISRRGHSANPKAPRPPGSPTSIYVFSS